MKLCMTLSWKVPSPHKQISLSFRETGVIPPIMMPFPFSFQILITTYQGFQISYHIIQKKLRLPTSMYYQTKYIFLLSLQRDFFSATDNCTQNARISLRHEFFNEHENCNKTIKTLFHNVEVRYFLTTPQENIKLQVFL